MCRTWGRNHKAALHIICCWFVFENCTVHAWYLFHVRCEAAMNENGNVLEHRPNHIGKKGNCRWWWAQSGGKVAGGRAFLILSVRFNHFQCCAVIILWIERLPTLANVAAFHWKSLDYEIACDSSSCSAAFHSFINAAIYAVCARNEYAVFLAQFQLESNGTFL